jgi:23S rRNA pseudouridine2457 synthase
MSKIVLFNKPYAVLTQFRPDGDRPTLAQFIADPSLRVAGRLDHDSEGLLLLTDDGVLNARITQPRHQQFKTYRVQVDGLPTEAALQQLRKGVMLNDGPTLAAGARQIDAPDIWPRTPPVRYRAALPTSWLEIRISEGRNRQVRRMTAAVGLPTLRLIRVQIGDYELGDLQPGEWRAAAARRGG